MAEHDTVMSKLYVINRHGERESVKFDKILTRIASLAEGLHPLVDPGKVAQGVINGMFAGISTSELDTLAAQVCAYSAASHPDYSKLASRIAADNLRKNTHESFAATIRELYEYKDQMDRNCSLISTDVFEFVQANAKELDAMIKYERDFDFDFFAFKTLERSYLLRINNKVVERPQHLWMRVACGIHCGDLEKVKETYELMSTKIATHATPTLFNSGTARPQMSSCFLLQMEDSIQDIYHVLSECALISKNAGGIGIAIHKIRATGTYIAGTNGRSNGLVPMLRVFNDTARYVDQGGGKRKGSFAVYLSPWHADVFEFLDLRKNHGKEEHRARDLFYALWIEDLFMERVEADADWSLMCPHQCPGLTDVYGDEFNELYTKYEKEGRVVKTVSARSLWFAILQAQIETGNPFLCYSDSANRKNNQKNIGVLYSSNLCTEVLIVTKPDEHGVCTLASLCLSKFVNTETKTFDFDKLLRVTKIITRNLNNVIDRNHYPVPAARKSSMRHRPIGIGVQGLADTFLLLRLDYESPEAAKLNAEIFECIYYGACEASCELAERDGPYETYWGSPASEGKLQFDLWNEEKKLKGRTDFVQLSGKWDWDALKERIKKFGLRNSLLTSPMPTASTSQIMGNCESFEPFTSNIYSRRVLSGEFVIVNPHLLKDLVERGLWNDDMKQKLIAAAGSVQHIPNIPEDLKRLYKTVWEIKCRTLIDLAAGRGPFIDQSQSLNLYMTNPTFSKLTSAHFHAWRAGLKTGCYYLRTRAAVDAIKFTVAPSAVAEAKAQAALTTTTSSAEDKENNNEAVIVCPRRRTGGLNYDPNEVCESCSA